MLRIARPPILFYGLYNTGVSDVDRQLLDIITVRGGLATFLDTLFLGSGPPTVASQVLFDMLLAALDRIIDLLALGADGSPDDVVKQYRSLAYWLVVRAILLVFQPGVRLPAPAPDPLGNTISAPILIEFPPARPEGADLTNELVRMRRFAPDATFARLISQAFLQFPVDLLIVPQVLASATEELFVQKSLERRWRELVRTVAPEAARQDVVFNWLQVVVMEAFSALVTIGLGPARVPTWDQEEIREGRFPPQYEQSLEVIAREI
jgi:hypothetical protein